MATITVRDLVRESKRVFDALEADGRPILVTRNGQPFAALMPVDQEQAEALLLASTPEISDMKSRLDKVIAAGGGTSLSEFLGEDDSVRQGADAQDGLAKGGADATERTLHGSDLASVIAQTTEDITENTVTSLARVVANSKPDDKWKKRIHELNTDLLELSFLRELDRAPSIAARTSALKKRNVGRRGSEARESARAEIALATARSLVQKLNSELLVNLKESAPDEIEETFESELRGGVIFAKFAGHASFDEGASSGERRHRKGLLRNR